MLNAKQQYEQVDELAERIAELAATTGRDVEDIMGQLQGALQRRTRRSHPEHADGQRVKAVQHVERRG